MTEEGELPEGWSSKPVLELCELHRGVTYSKGEAREAPLAGFVPMLRANNIRDKIELRDLQYVPASRVRPDQYVRHGDVLVALSSGSKAVVGKAASIEDDWFGAFGAFCGVFRPSASIDKIYFGMFFRTASYRRAISEASAGTNINNLRRDSFRALSVPLPPVSEQVRIGLQSRALSTSVDGARARLDRALTTLALFRRAVLAAACDGRLTESWRIQSEGIDDWPTVTLDSVADSFSYGTAAKSSSTGRVPVLRMGNIQDGQLDWTNLVYTSDAREIAKYRLSRGDVLFNRTNSPELVGKTAVYRGEREAVYAGYLIRVRCTDRLLPDFLNYSLNGPAGKEYLASVRTDGVSQSNINAKSLAAFEFGLPSVAEQREIVRRVEALFALADAIKKRVASATARADKLTQSILAKAFRGELVPTEAELARRRGASTSGR